MKMKESIANRLGVAMSKLPLVSIVIPTYKSVNTLKHVLESIKKQTYNKIEVIVVDRPTGNGTEDLVKEFGYKYVPYDSERTKAVNYGVKHSQGDFIYYIGSDYVLESNLIEETAKTVVKEGADAAIITNVIKQTGFWSKVKQLEKETYIGDDLIEATRFISRKAFLDIGGYDEEMIAFEEHDLHNRLLKKGYEIVRVRGVREKNIGEPTSLLEYALKYYYYGETIRKYTKKYPRKSMLQLNPIRPSYIKYRRKFIEHPILTIGFIIYQFTRYISAGLGFLVSEVKE